VESNDSGTLRTSDILYRKYQISVTYQKFVRYQISLHNTKLKNVVSSGTSEDEVEGVAAYRRPTVCAVNDVSEHHRAFQGLLG
jgi:phage tail tube protein FII